MIDLKNYYALWMAMGFIRYPRVSDYWELQTTNSGLTGCQFFHDVMGRDKWRAIDRCLQAKLPWIQSNFYETSVKNWNLSEILCIDESLVLWKGRRGYKIKLDKKHAQTGQMVWNLCDESYFTWCYTWQGDVSSLPEVKNKTNKYGQHIIQSFEKLLPNEAYIIITDAGSLSTMSNMEYLSNKKRKFVMSIKASNVKFAVQNLRKGMKLYQWDAYYSDSYSLLTWRQSGNI